MKKIIIFISIIFLAFFLRYSYLDQVPSGLDYDESEFAFNAYSLLKHGVNENQEFLPYQVDTYGNYRPMGLVYFIALSLNFFGNNIFAVRFPNIMFGVFGVIGFFIFIKHLFGKQKIAFLGAFLLALNPWHIYLSRGTAEPVMALFFIILMLICLILFFEKKKNIFLPFVYIFGLISFFTYTGVLPIIFLFSFAICLYFFIRKKKIFWLSAIPFVAIILFPLIPVMMTNPGYLNGRFKQTSVFYGIGKEGIHLVNQEKIREIGRNRIEIQNKITQVFHNIPTSTLNTILTNWGEHLNPAFLYFKGGKPMRLQVPDSGIFLPIEFILLISGILFIYKDRKKGMLFLSFSFIMIGFFPAALTIEEIPSTHRTIFAVIGFLIFESYFLSQLKNSFFDRLTKFLIIAGLTYGMTYALHNYLVMQPRHKNAFRHFEMNEVAKYIAKNEAKFENIYITKNGTEPGYYYYFFNNKDPWEFIKSKTKSHLKTWSLGKFHFIHAPCADVEIKGKALIFEGAAFCQGSGAFVKYIYNSDGEKVYRVVER